MGDSGRPERITYLSAFAELVKADPSRLSADTRHQVMRVLADPGIDVTGAEAWLSGLAETDEQVADLWDEVQQQEPDAQRGTGLVSPWQPGHGPTHTWLCPVQGCPTPPEPGLGWATISGATHCAQHGKALEPVRIPDA
jgi:hypothetical protein